MREIAALLTGYQLRSRLVLVPFGELQQQVVLAVPPELRVVVYRRLMLRIAERLARRWHARALVTGEVIGQVASQTLENMTTIAERDGHGDAAAARRDGQGRDFAPKPSASARSPFRSSRIRTAARCSRRGIRPRARGSPMWSPPSRPCRWTTWSRRPWPRPQSRTSFLRRRNCYQADKIQGSSSTWTPHRASPMTMQRVLTRSACWHNFTAV